MQLSTQENRNAYDVIANNHLGLHIEFHEEISPSNFKFACNIAINLAKNRCKECDSVAVNFVADGFPVQVVESDNVDIQMALWLRRLNFKNLLL